ncbi:hypothetical protein AX14_004971 [Amanita brunnescens Koide BX004]|nr:hypothetical protein AX14_004971 [Amanita brunnescens Koide BX004]
MKFFSAAAVLGFLVTIGFMSNVAVAVSAESSSDGGLVFRVKRQNGDGADVSAQADVDA